MFNHSIGCSRQRDIAHRRRRQKASHGQEKCYTTGRLRLRCRRPPCETHARQRVLHRIQPCLPAGRYDAANRLTLLENKKSDGTVISSFAYQMDNVGNRTRMTYADGDYIDYTYDELNLRDETRTGTTSYSQQFAYDAVGNRTELIKSGEGMGQTVS